MNDNLLIGIVGGVVLVGLYLLLRWKRQNQQRCPACQRLGRGKHYGRYCCAGCGAHFVLDADGRPQRSVWEVVLGPLLLWILAGGCLLVAWFRNARDFPLQPSSFALFTGVIAWEFYRAFREKKFG